MFSVLRLPFLSYEHRTVWFVMGKSHGPLFSVPGSNCHHFENILLCSLLYLLSFNIFREFSSPSMESHSFIQQILIVYYMLYSLGNTKTRITYSSCSLCKENYPSSPCLSEAYIAAICSTYCVCHAL